MMKRAVKFLLVSILLMVTDHAVAADATPFGPPIAMTSITATLQAGGGTDVNVQWSGGSDNGTTITGYQAIPFSGDPTYGTQALVSCSASGTSDSCTVTGLAYATKYKFKVITLSSGGSVTSGFSNEVTTPSQTQDVTITGTPSSYTYGSADFQLFATSDSGLPISSWSIPSTTSICSVDASGTVHFTAVGTCTVRATQDGSGSAYASDYDEVSITATATLSATIGSATSVQSAQATLNATVPYSGADTTPEFCVSTTNSATDSCSLPAGVSIGSYSPSTITASSSSSVSAVASGLSQSTTYYFWIKVSASGATSYKTGTSSFTTSTGPSLAFSGGTSLTVGTATTGTLTASSGSGVYASWSANSLPGGITFNPGETANTSTITGTPTTAGTFATLFSVTDSSGLETQLTVSFTVANVQSSNSNNSNNSNSNSSSSNNNSSSGGSGSSGGSATSTTPKEPTNSKYQPVKGVTTLTNGEPEVSGGSEQATITLNEAGTGYLISGNNWFVKIYSQNKIYKNSSSGELGRIALIAGEKIFADGEGLLANDQADFWMLPRTTLVHSKLIAADSSLTTSFILAKNWPAGEHVLQARFKASDGVLRTVSLPLVVLPADGKYENLPTSVVSKTISSPIRTLFNLRDLPNYAKVKLPIGKVRGVDALTLGGRLIYVTPTKSFSGIILFPISIKGKYTTVERYISLTVQTPAVTGATYQTTSVAQTKVIWNKVTNATSYIVTKNKTKVCESKVSSCTFASISGPNSIIQIKSIGADGVESKLVTANYNFNAKFAIVATVNFDNNSSVLNAGSIKTLQNFMSSYKKEGFNAVTVVGYADSTGSTAANQKISTQRANTVSSFLNGKETGYVDSIGKGQKNPIKSNATSKGQAANRRVEILVK